VSVQEDAPVADFVLIHTHSHHERASSASVEKYQIRCASQAVTGGTLSSPIHSDSKRLTSLRIELIGVVHSSSSSQLPPAPSPTRTRVPCSSASHSPPARSLRIHIPCDVRLQTPHDPSLLSAPRPLQGHHPGSASSRTGDATLPFAPLSSRHMRRLVPATCDEKPDGKDSRVTPWGYVDIYLRIFESLTKISLGATRLENLVVYLPPCSPCSRCLYPVTCADESCYRSYHSGASTTSSAF
jgi:hypothetical protein